MGQHHSDVGGARSSLTVDDAPIRVRVDQGLVVIEPSGGADPDTTSALTDALNAAVAAGTVAVIDLDGDAGPPLRLPAPAAAERRGTARPRPAEPVEPDGIRLPTATGSWTLDWTGRRLCCAERRNGRAIAEAGEWTIVRRLWVSATCVTALTAAGGYRTARR